MHESWLLLANIGPPTTSFDLITLAAWAEKKPVIVTCNFYNC